MTIPTFRLSDLWRWTFSSSWKICSCTCSRRHKRQFLLEIGE